MNKPKLEVGQEWYMNKGSYYIIKKIKGDKVILDNYTSDKRSLGNWESNWIIWDDYPFYYSGTPASCEDCGYFCKQRCKLVENK